MIITQYGCITSTSLIRSKQKKLFNSIKNNYKKILQANEKGTAFPNWMLIQRHQEVHISELGELYLDERGGGRKLT